MLGISFEDNEGVIGILQDGARKGGGERVFKHPIAGCQKDKMLEGVSNKDEEVGREGLLVGGHDGIGSNYLACR